MADPWKELVDQIRDITDAGYADDTLLSVLKDQVELKEPHPGFAPCPTCHQYSHSIGEDVLSRAFIHFQSMFSHRGDDIPTQFTFDEQTRDAAQVLMTASKFFLGKKVQIAANMSGGVLQGASCNFPGVELYVLDFDDVPMDDESKDRVIEVEGSDAYLSQVVCEHDEPFVQEVVNAPTRADEEVSDEVDDEEG